MGKTCVICGKPTGTYVFCREHQAEKDNGKIVKCESCGEWHYVDKPCKNCGEGDIVKKSKNPDWILDWNDNSTNKDSTSDLKCIICGDDSNGKYFCKSCYYRYKNKEILIRIAKCQFPCGEPLDESYEGVYECDDGHIVKSIAEQTIDNYLCEKAIFHGYELPLDVGMEKPLKPDFCLKDYLGQGEDVYIEYFGLKGQPEYDKKTAYKMEHYRKKNITLICLYPNTDTKNLRFSLQTKLVKDKIKKGEIMYEQK